MLFLITPRKQWHQTKSRKTFAIPTCYPDLIFLSLVDEHDCDAVDCKGRWHEGETFPNPYECISFCLCSHDEAYKRDCPGGLDWNDELKVCDWPERAKCSIENKTPDGFESVSVRTSPPKIPHTKLRIILSFVNETPGKHDCDAVECDSPGSFGDMFPNPYDCKSFCICGEDGAERRDCPEGLEFDWNADRCEYPKQDPSKPGGCSVGNSRR